MTEISNGRAGRTLKRHEFRAMGVSVECLSEWADEAGCGFEAVELEFERLESIFSRFRPESELSRLNELGALDAGPELVELTLIALAAREETAGRFDPTVHDALIAAGYDRTFSRVPAASEEIEPVPAARCGGEVTVDREAGRIELGDAVRLDFGGIAKGYAADRTCDLLAASGACLVNAGGDLVARDLRSDETWPVSINTETCSITLGLRNAALATSGRDVRRWRRNGIERHHLIDPATGQPSRSGPPACHRRRADGGRGRGPREDAVPGGRSTRDGRGRRAPDSLRARDAGRAARPRGRVGVRSDPTFWILARASGMTAYLLVTVSLLAGLVLKSRPLGTRVKPAAVTDLHRFLALMALAATAIHGLALVFDTAVPIDVAGLLVPGRIHYRPLWTGAGVIGAELMVVIYVSFSQRKRIGVRNWRRLHWLTYAVFASVTVHGLFAGSDSANRWAQPVYLGAIGAVAFATAWRALVRPARKKPVTTSR